MRLLISLSIVSTACSAVESEDTGHSYYYAGGSSSAPPPELASDTDRATWVQVELGFCEFHSSSDGGASWSPSVYVNIDGSDSPEKLTGGADELIEIFCDASVVPQYDPPRVIVDPKGCPKVYCNPWGGTNKVGGEAADCGEDLWVYVYPASDAADCGPWDLL